MKISPISSYKSVAFKKIDSEKTKQKINSVSNDIYVSQKLAGSQFVDVYSDKKGTLKAKVNFELAKKRGVDDLFYNENSALCISELDLDDVSDKRSLETLEQVAYKGFEYENFHKDIVEAMRWLRYSPLIYQRFIEISKNDADNKIISFSYAKDPFNKNEKPKENLGFFAKIAYKNEMNKRQGNDNAFHNIIKNFESEVHLEKGWMENLDCNTPQGMSRLLMVAELNKRIYEYFYPEPAPHQTALQELAESGW